MGLDDDTAVKTCGAGEVMETGGQHVEEELVVAVTVQDTGDVGGRRTEKRLDVALTEEDGILEVEVTAGQG